MMSFGHTAKMKTNLDNEMAHRIVICLQSMGNATPILDGPHKYFQYDKWWFELERDAAIAFDEVMALLRQSVELSSILSEKEIRRQFQQLLGQLFTKYGVTDHCKTLKHEIHRWWDGLFSLPEESVTFYYVIEGLSVSSDLVIGFASIERLDADRFEALGQRLFDLINANPHYCPSAKHLINQSLMQNWMPHFEPSGEKPLALISIPVRQRDIGLGTELAQTRLDETVDFLRFAALQKHYDLQSPITIAVRGRLGNQLGVYCVFHEDGGWRLGMQREGSAAVALDNISPVLLALIGPILAKTENERTVVEGKLIRAIQYLGKAAAELLLTNQLLFAWFALETLVQKFGGRTSGNQISAHAAALLTDDPVKYEQVKSALIEVKDKRNKIVHLGLSRLMNEDKKLVSRIKRLAFESICKLAELAIQHKWTSAEEIEQYIEDRLPTSDIEESS